MIISIRWCISTGGADHPHLTYHVFPWSNGCSFSQDRIQDLRIYCACKWVIPWPRLPFECQYVRELRILSAYEFLLSDISRMELGIISVDIMIQNSLHVRNI